MNDMEGFLGRGELLGDRGDNFFNQPLEIRVRQMGWSQACPIVPEVIKEYGKSWKKEHPEASRKEVKQKGEEMARQRYAECNFVFGMITEAAKVGNPDLYEKLLTPSPRVDDERVGIYYRGYVPKTHSEELSPLSTLWGYALPRVILEQMGRGENNEERNAERVIEAMKMIDEEVRVARNPEELVAKVAERAVNGSTDPKAILGHLLSTGVYEEENCREMAITIYQAMRDFSPKLTEVYDALSRTDKGTLGIMNFFGNETLGYQPITFVSSSEVRPGVTCEVYAFDGESDRDLGIIHIEAGKKTPRQMVLRGEATQECYISGKGRLTVTRVDGQKSIYEVDGNIPTLTAYVGIDDVMQWEAAADSELVFAEICYPPFEKGRFMDLD